MGVPFSCLGTDEFSKGPVVTFGGKRVLGLHHSNFTEAIPEFCQPTGLLIGS